jgi:hypothetical protein
MVVILLQRRPDPAAVAELRTRTTSSRSPLSIEERADDPLIGIMHLLVAGAGADLPDMSLSLMG